jgi:protein-disulfide isomerase
MYFRNLFILFASLFFVSACTLGSESPANTGSSQSSQITPLESSPIETTQYGSGNHVIQIFADFQCPACIRFSQTLGPVLESYAASGKVVLEFRQYPLTNIHANAYRDALAALCAADQKKYWTYKKWLYALEQKRSGAKVSDQDRIDLATAAGITDLTVFQQCLSTEAKKSQIEADIQAGDLLRLEWTPTVYLDGKKLDLWVIFRDYNKGLEYMNRVLSE